MVKEPQWKNNHDSFLHSFLRAQDAGGTKIIDDYNNEWENQPFLRMNQSNLENGPIEGPLHTRAKSRDHEIVRAQEKEKRAK